MKPNHKLSLSLTALIFGGCSASFEPRLSSSDLTAPRLATVREVRGGLEVSVEEFASPHKSRKAFDADVTRNGVLPLLVRIENKGVKSFKVRRNQVKAYQDRQTLPPIYGFEAAKDGAMRNYTWNALVNTASTGPLAMFFWPATMAGSASQTQTINRRIEHHFESLELSDTLLKPDETTAGFIYFKIPEGLETLEKLSMEMIIEPEGFEGERSELFVYRLSFPTINLLAPVSSQHPENKG